MRYIKIGIWNIIILASIILFFETFFYFSRLFLDRTNIGWVYRTQDKTQVLEEHPCVRMETHPVLSHIPDHRGECDILGGYADGPFVRYSETKKHNKAIVTLGGSTTSGFYQHYADGKTWPYILDQLLKTNNFEYNLLNGGHGGYSSSDELHQLLLNVRRINENIKIIISLNGINDLNLQTRGNYFLSERVNQMDERQMWIDQTFMPRFLPNIFSFIRYFSPKLTNIETKAYNLGKREKNIISNIKDLSVVNIWESNIKSMKEISNVMGIEYFVFLQPTMGLEGPQSEMPKEVNSKDGEMLKVILEDNGGFKEGYKKGYRNLLNKNYKSFKKICNSLNYCFDISDIAPPEGNNYSNPRHHNHNGNKIIANEIFKILKKNNVL